jgi:hypothetical protein
MDEVSNVMMCYKEGMQEAKVLPQCPKGTLEIDLNTGKRVQNRLVIYGQRHITGLDIEQPDCGRALLTLEAGCTIGDLVQGVFRMRKILYGQCVDFVITSQYRDLIVTQLPKIMAFEAGGAAGASEGGLGASAVVGCILLPSAEAQLKIEDLIIMSEYSQYERMRAENKTSALEKINASLKESLIFSGQRLDPGKFAKVYDSVVFVKRPNHPSFVDLRFGCRRCRSNVS